MINFALPVAGKVSVNIFNETGQLVRTLVDGERAAGNYSLRWNGRNQAGNAVAAGVYLYQIVVSGQNGAPAFTQTRRMMYLK
jgi:flagellar hook assembly protein FlgD